jgi:hypothetical protein
MPRRRPPRPEDALARVVLDGYLGVRRGEPVTIETWSHALPWARAFVVESRRRGARPALIVEDESAFFRSLESLGAASVAGAAGAPADGGGAHVYLDGPEEFPRLLGLLPDDRERLLARHDRAWWGSARRRRVRAIRVAIADASPTAATRYGVDTETWQTELLRASLVDPGPLVRSGARIARSLARARRLRIRHPNGTDLVVERSSTGPVLDAGPPDPAEGTVWGRVPSGLLLVPLRVGAGEGAWESNRPAYNRFVEPPVAIGARFTFRAGRLTEFSFDRGGAPFAAAYARAGSRRVRPIALTIGLNPAVSHAPELQELGEGTVGLLLGDAPYRADGSRPRFSFLAALAGADVDADGRPWLVGGRPGARANRPVRPGGRAPTRRTGRRTR